MATWFTPNRHMLPKGQRELWPLLAPVPSHFVLYGGTALAIQLGHRISVDFDFFSSKSFDPLHLHDSLGFLKDGRVTQMSENTLSCEIPFAESKGRISLFGELGLNYVEEPMRADTRLRVASLLDIGGMKVAVIQRRLVSSDLGAREK